MASRRDLTVGALGIWAGSRLAVGLLGMAASIARGGGASFLSLWSHWDVPIFVRIAQHGYFAPGRPAANCCDQAYFPGEPLALRAMHLVVPNWTVAGLVLSLAAGAVAVVALAQLAALDCPDPAAGGRRAVTYLVLSPYAIFLFVGYSEALFLACAVPAWLAARQRRWLAAGVLAALAASVRVTGVFLAVALVVHYVTTEYLAAVRPRRLRQLAEAAGLLLPLVTLGTFELYLFARFHDWLAWLHAQARGWGRTFATPWASLRETLHAAWAPGTPAAFVWSWRGDIAVMALGLGLTVVLLVTRRYGEATYVGLTAVSLGISSFYLSVARVSLLWFPLWTALARIAVRRRWVHATLPWVMAPLMAALVVVWTSGAWVD
ncbi:MAG: hypothetical protein ACYDAQ_16075 [Mycobacteriales bacterium]